MYQPIPIILLAAMGVALTNSASPGAESATFERDVLPILTAHCMGCHGGLKQKGDLDLRSIPAMLKGGKSGPAVKAGDVDGSPLWEMIESGEMPKGEKKLTAAEKDVLRRWIAAKLPTVKKDRDDAAALNGDGSHAPHEVAAAIDAQIEAVLKRDHLAAAGRAADADAEFLRRIYLDLTGRVPTAAQAAAFLDDAASDKRSKLIDALLASPQFGEQLGRTWRDWIAPPELPSDPNSGKQPVNETRALGKWLGDRFNAGDSWDKIARAIIGVEGELKNNPQLVALGLMGEAGKTSPAGSARGVASLFMGVQFQCAQCHDDPYRVLSQDEFWQLAAFFKKANGDFNKLYEVPPPPKPDPKKPEDPNKKPKPVDPATIGTIDIPKSAFKNVGKRVPAKLPGGDYIKPDGDTPMRPALLDWLTAKDNPYFARAFVNRTWFYFFNRGIVHPVDDMRDLNPPSHPGLLDLLEREFKASNYDVKHLVRCICNSQAYQRSSKPVAGENEAQAVTLVASFGRMPARVMTADQLYDSLKLAYGDPRLDLRSIDPKDGNTNGESAAVGDEYLEFQRKFCTNEEDAADFTHGIPQMLAMLNHPRLLAGGPMLAAYAKVPYTPIDKEGKPGKTVPAPKGDAPPPATVIEWLYLSTLSRRPTAEEAGDALTYVTGAKTPAEAYAGVLWMLVNRSEFMLVR